MVRKISSVCIAVLLFLFVYAYSFAGDESRPGIELDGAPVQDTALIDGGSVYLPLRAIGEALGYKIEWLGKDQGISVTRAGQNIRIDLKNSRITANEHSYYMSGDYSGLTGNMGKTVDGKTYMGAGFFSENFGLTVHPDGKGGRIILESVRENALSIQNIKEASETDKIKMTLQYPQIDGLEDKTVQDGINACFRGLAEAARDEGLKNVEDTAGYPGSPNQHETYFDYRIKYNQNGLLSVVFADYQYYGGAHGMTVQSSSTFDLKTGGRYKLKELFRDGSDYASIINSAVRKQIDERVKAGMLPEFPDSPFKSIRDDQDFYLSNNGIVVYFQQYEYFPYAAGIQEFTVDYSSLENALLPDFGFLTNKETALSESSKLPAVEATESNRYIPGNGTAPMKPEELIADYLTENGTKGDVSSYLKVTEITVKEAWENTGVRLYAVDVDYAGLYGVAVIKDGKVLEVLNGMPTKSIFLADLDNDGYYEVYTNAYYGSGIVSLEIRGYNIASDMEYSLSMRMEKDLELFVKDRVLQVKEYLPANPPLKADSEPVSTGVLVLRGDNDKKELAVEPSESLYVNAPLYGSKAVYAAEDGLYCTDMDSGRRTLLTGGTGISKPVFSNGGESVAYLRDGNLYAYDFAASQSRLLLEKVDSFCRGKDYGFYASSEKNGIVAVNFRTAESPTIIPAEKDASYIHLALSPDGRLLAYEVSVSGVGNQGKGGVWIYDTGTKKSKAVAENTKAGADSLGTRSSVGKWSPDSGKLFLWLMSQSASLSADGVGTAVYDAAAGTLAELETGALAYDENVSFADSNSLVVLTGGGRETFKDKSLSRFDLENGPTARALETPGLIPAAPCYSADGKKLVFAASPEAALSKRQIYAYTDGGLFALTGDDKYRSEAPVFLNNNNYIVFARMDADGNKSIWLMDSDGSGPREIAGWKYADPNDLRSMDFYGRIDWSAMFDVFDGSKAPNG